MTNWYCSREQVKSSLGIYGLEHDKAIDLAIEGASRRVDTWTRRRFIPETKTVLLSWPPRQNSLSWKLWLPLDIISVTTLRTKAQDSSPTTIVAADYFLEPQYYGPPYDRIEIDLSSTASFEAGDTSQRSISVLGSWGYKDATKSTGTIDDAGGISATETTLIVSDASLIDVGDTLLIETEQIFVSNRDFAALGTVLINGALTATITENVVADPAHGIKAGEVIRVDTEQMFVLYVSGNTLTVTRAYNGSVLASHADNTAIHINRTLTIERAINGTTGATHADAVAISKYEVPFDIGQWCRAESIAVYTQEGAGWGRIIGQGDGAREFGGRDLSSLRETMIKQYKRVRVGTI